jgi:hypothetical protein
MKAGRKKESSRKQQEPDGDNTNQGEHDVPERNNKTSGFATLTRQPSILLSALNKKPEVRRTEDLKSRHTVNRLKKHNAG